MTSPVILELKDLTMQFGGVKALNQVNLSVKRRDFSFNWTKRCWQNYRV